MSAEADAASVPQGRILLDLVEALHSGDGEAQVAARTAVKEEMGLQALVDSCATIASFNAVVKIADGTGIDLEEAKEVATSDIRSRYDIDSLKAG